MQTVQLSDTTNRTRQLPLLRDSFDLWRSDPIRAFREWITTATFVPEDPVNPGKKPEERKYSAATIDVYASMFAKFNTWCDENDLAFPDVKAKSLTEFLDNAVRPRRKHAVESPAARAIEARNHKRHRRAYLRLLERVYDRLIELGADIVNPASGAAKVRNAQDNPTRFLSATDRDKFVDHLRSVVPAGEEKRKKRKKDEAWIDQRDRTMALVLLGAGLKISELRAMALNCISDSGVIHLRAPQGRQITPLPFARDALVAWVATHQAQKLPDAVLFPPSRGGAGRLPPGPTTRLHLATVHRRMHALLRAAGVRLPDQGERLCAQTMRNTYAAALIDAGADDAMLADRLHVTDYTAARLRRAYQRARALEART